VPWWLEPRARCRFENREGYLYMGHLSRDVLGHAPMGYMDQAQRAMHQRATRTGPCLAQWAWGEAQAQFGASLQKTSCRVMLGQKKAGFVPARVTRPTWPARPVNSPRRMREDATRDHHRPKEMLNFLLHYPYSLITNGFGSRH
jgi:hypothetical protein